MSNAHNWILLNLAGFNLVLAPEAQNSKILSWVEPLFCTSLPFILRKRLAQLRLGCLPIRVETDRYTRPIVHRDQRYCLQPKCLNIVSNLSDSMKHVENEYHFLMKCSQYDQLRSEMFAQIQAADFAQMNDLEKFIFLLTTQSVAKIVAQFIVDAYDERTAQL